MRGVVFALSMLATAAAAQTRVDPLVYPAGTRYADEYKVPVVSGIDERAADKINLAIQHEILGIVPGHFATPMFPEDERNSGTTSADFTVVRADAQIVSLDIGREFMGAYPSYGRMAMSFDVHDGNPIAASDIFTPAGLKKAQSTIDTRLVAAIRKIIAHPDPGRVDPKNGDAADDLATQRDAYNDCIENIREHDWNTTFQLGDELSVKEGCGFPHVIQALDDVGEVEWKVSYASLAPDLTDYGRCLLVDRRSDCKRDHPTPAVGVWRGTLGKTAISLIGNQDGLVYLYDRYGEAIGLKASTVTPGHWVIVRTNGEGPVIETFDLETDPKGGFVGTWTQPGKAALPVRLR